MSSSRDTPPKNDLINSASETHANTTVCPSMLSNIVAVAKSII